MEARPCRVCGELFAPKQARSAVCSKRCSSRYYRSRESGECGEAGCTRPIRARGLCGTHYNKTYFPDSQKRWPSKDLEARRRALRRKTQKRRAVQAQVEAETIDRDKVGDRDGWRCFCGKRIDRKLPWPHPRSASLDHIVPISEHGPHTYANVRIAHLVCNNSRGNRGGNEQLALIG